MGKKFWHTGKTKSDRTSSPRQEYSTPWLLREVAGAPVWSMIAFGAVILGIAVLSVLQR
jgi:hypothetical protein